MRFKRGTYRLRLAPECERPFSNILKRFASLNLPSGDFLDGLNKIRDDVQMGNAPPGTKTRRSRPGLFFLPVNSHHVAFRVDEVGGLVVIEDLR